jgi:hypothetical protein
MEPPLAPTDSLAELAAGLGVRREALDAVVQVESSGAGLLPARARSPEGRDVGGFPVIRFEAHVFYRELQAIGIIPGAVKVSRPDIIRRKRDDSLVKSREGEWDRIGAARLIDRDAADRSASWGRFQIMGFNWEACGADDVRDFVGLMHADEGQLELFAGFLRANPQMVRALKALDWRTFAKLYNGPGYAANDYHGRMARAFRKLAG